MKKRINLNPASTTGVNKSPAKKSQTMAKSNKKRRESVLTSNNSSKLSSKFTDKNTGSIKQNKFRRFLTMAMKSNVEEESSEDDPNMV
jgi:hypothetical protein